MLVDDFSLDEKNTHHQFCMAICKYFIAACTHKLCIGSAFSIKRFFAFVASAKRAVLFTIVFVLAVSCCWLLKVLICTHICFFCCMRHRKTFHKRHSEFFCQVLQELPSWDFYTIDFFL